MAKMTDAERDAFLRTPRLGILTTLADDGAPVSVPVWFEWDGNHVRLFSSVTAGKVKRIKRDPRVTLLAANAVGEPEAWVAFDGSATISRDGAFALAERLAHRYWDMTSREKQATLAEWRKAERALRVIEIIPRAIRTSKG